MEKWLNAAKQLVDRVTGSEVVQLGEDISIKAGESIAIGADPSHADYADALLQGVRRVKIEGLPVGGISRACLNIGLDTEGHLSLAGLTDRNDLTVIFSTLHDGNWHAYLLPNRIGGKLAPKAEAELRVSDQLNVRVNIENGDGQRYRCVVSGASGNEGIFSEMQIRVLKGAAVLRRIDETRSTLEKNKFRN